MTTITPKWVPYSGRHGWLWDGVVPAAQLPGLDFWSKAVRVTAQAEGGQVDMVQCYDAGIMTAGPLGATARFGTLAHLLANIQRPLLEQYLGKLFEQQGVGLHVGADGAWFTLGLRRAAIAELTDIFLGGSDGAAWNGEQVDLAEAWTKGLAALLADPASHRGVMAASTGTIRGYLTQQAAGNLGWPPGLLEPPRGAPQVLRASACWLSFAINNPAGALRLLGQAGPDADAMLRAAGGPPGAWPSTFAQRVSRVRRALAAEVWL